MVSIGSMARTMPGRSFMPRPGGPSLGTPGSSCMLRPMPWPPKPSGTPYPAARPTVPTAWAMSPILLPGTAAAIPAASAASAVSISRRSAGRARPTVKLTAASPTQPPSFAPQSMLTRSPSRSR